MNYTLTEIASWINGEVVGNGNIEITSLSPITDILPGTLVFADGDEHLKTALASEAAALLVGEQVTIENKPCIKVHKPYQAFIKLLEHFRKPVVTKKGIHPSASIGEHVTLGADVYVGPYVVIEDNSIIGDRVILKSHIHVGQSVSIGDDSVIHPHVTIYDHCLIGKNVSIHANTVVGSDGFGYQFIDGKHQKMPHIGIVRIEDDVEIGANTAIDRATLGATVIGQGTKIDNLVQVAHSVKLGKHNILCAFTGVAGSTTAGDYVIFAANVGVSDHVTIENNVVLGARTGVPPNKTLKEGLVYLGSPARPKDKAIELELSVTRIPFMRKNIKALGEQIAELQKKLSEQETKE